MVRTLHLTKKNLKKRKRDPKKEKEKEKGKKKRTHGAGGKLNRVQHYS